TNSIPIVNELINSDVEVIIIGGKLRHNESSIVAYDYLFNFGTLNISKSFICSGGITLDKGISDYNMDEAITRKKILEISNEVFVAADSSKLGRDVPINICGIDKVNYVITDSSLDSSIE
ncbi:DeoR-family transcriptional regulator, partial [human gut metagenome]